MARPASSGFTLVELIMVLVLISVLSVTAISLFPDSDVYSERTTRDFVLTSVRQAQQVAMARASANSVTLTFSRSTSQLQSTLSASDGATLTATMPESLIVRGGTDLVSACTALPALPLQLAFDGDGRLVPGQAIRLCAADGFDVCVSPSGYAYAGSCL